MNSAEETESLTDMALGFLMWAIMASVAAFLVLLKKWFLKKCCGEERSTNNQPTQQPTLNPAFSPGQLSVIPLMVMHTSPSSTISGSPSSTSVAITPEINREEEEEEEPVGHRTRLSCARRLNWSKTSVVLF
ncbi:uncharacterized protein LOC128174671 [Crassostrea angulata]|uniref:uncharacterized protein LOC128174671 n=1 Tax=Magallana angulata TaxID=2784310 RepID=UPI0022B216D0|nr:uncharacterized protein LOC128174671 [Crassostrea angulata]